jgi:hypothetical protein
MLLSSLSPAHHLAACWPEAVVLYILVKLLSQFTMGGRA